MAMTGAGLAALRKSKIIAAFGPATNDSQLDAWLLADSEAIVEYIQANADVSSTGTVLTGPGAGGAVSTTGTVS
jgi:hypothetical protein